MDGWYKAMEKLVWLSQLGLSLLVPPVGLMWLSSWLVASKGAPGWLYLPALALGLGASGVTFYRFCRTVLRQTPPDPQRARHIYFNKHH